MKYWAILSLFLCSFVFSKQTIFDGKIVETIAETKSIQCEIGGIETVIEYWPLEYEESDLCGRETLGFRGMCLYTSWENSLTRSDGTKVGLPKIHKLKSDSELILQGRYYLESPIACDGNRIYMSLWGGGNCKNGCAVGGYLEISNIGEILDSRIIPVSELPQPKK